MLDFDKLDKALADSKQEWDDQQNGRRIDRDEWWAGVRYLDLCSILEENAEELIRLAKIGASVDVIESTPKGAPNPAWEAAQNANKVIYPNTDKWSGEDA